MIPGNDVGAVKIRQPKRYRSVYYYSNIHRECGHWFIVTHNYTGSTWIEEEVSTGHLTLWSKGTWLFITVIDFPPHDKPFTFFQVSLFCLFTVCSPLIVIIYYHITVNLCYIILEYRFRKEESTVLCNKIILGVCCVFHIGCLVQPIALLWRPFPVYVQCIYNPSTYMYRSEYRYRAVKVFKLWDELISDRHISSVRNLI